MGVGLHGAEVQLYNRLCKKTLDRKKNRWKKLKLTQKENHVKLKKLIKKRGAF